MAFVHGSVLRASQLRGAPLRASRARCAVRVSAPPLAASAGAARACAAGASAGRKARRRRRARARAAGQRRVSAIGVLFLAITYAWGVLAFVPVLLAHPLVLLLDARRRRFSQAVGLCWLRVSLACVGIRTVIEGKDNLPDRSETVVYVSNHASNMDIYVLPFLNRALKVVAKAEIFKTPIVGWAMRMAGNIGVKREDRAGQARAFRTMVEVLRSGTSLVVYPEGTRSESGRMSKFKRGAFRAAIAAGVPIVPCTITGTREMMPSYAYVPLRYPSRPFTVTVHPAIETAGRSVDELRELAFRAVESSLEPEVQSSMLLPSTDSEAMEVEVDMPVPEREHPKV